jgi:hypothetical protein
MGRTPRTAFSWNRLQEELGGSFTARALNLPSTEFALLGPDGKEFGSLRPRGHAIAEFESGDYTAALKRSGRSHRMVAYGDEMLAAVPKRRSIDELEISCGSQTYEVKASFFRNLATASYSGAEKVVRLSGGLTGRSYEALFATEDGCALRVAVFLLWHLTANRRRAYRMGSLTGGGEM